MRSGSDDERYMRMACRLARRGEGKTRPNPMVGAVLVKRGRIIGTGYHRKSGSPHAEVLAIQKATEKPENSSLYVNLEPCAHYGQTPPCVDLILEKGIKRVVIGTRDPNPVVNGKSIRVLRKHGIEVTCGVLKEECSRLNEVFFKFMKTGRPFVTLKAALSLDGKIACHTGESKWISSAASRKKVHRLRGLVDAILVGIGTVQKDDPRLTVRGIPGAQNPLRVILDSRLQIPYTARVLKQEAPTLVATTNRAPKKKVERLREMGVVVERIPSDRKGRVSLTPLLEHLGERRIQHLLIEGGSGVYTSAWEERIVDKVLLFVAPLLLGGHDSPGIFGGRGLDDPKHGFAVNDLRIRRSDRDLLLEGYPVNTGHKNRV